MEMISVAWEDTKSNLADLLTKIKTKADREGLIDRLCIDPLSKNGKAEPRLRPP